MELIGYILALFVGLSLGLIGSGGSIFTLPILVYVMGIPTIEATAYSLFIVGSTAVFSSIQYAKQKLIDYKTAVIFGIPSIVAVYMSRKFIVPQIPDVISTIGNFQLTKSIAMMLLFSVVMLLASISMLKSGKREENTEKQVKLNLPLIAIEGLLVGTLTGLVGAGGGFLIIPALTLLAGLPMKKAIGTSLMIISLKSLLGFIGDIETQAHIDWLLLTVFTAVSILGGTIGYKLAKKTDGGKLKVIFAYVVMSMGIYIIIKELLIK
ncbi:MAG TPA: sulfite exporter TauE/SafE family protein [Bacteroidia bacterium]